MRGMTPEFTYPDDNAVVVRHYADRLLSRCVPVADAATDRSFLLRSNGAQVPITAARLRAPTDNYQSRHGNGSADITLATL
ncbi:hypothetical protein ACGFJT_36870 [Actinomadura geliboluensis]|uniref:hypothetical protein n=1 Tax=Actinomadura geliboluensis TaxID=882440 RepID=UPI0037244F42